MNIRLMGRTVVGLALLYSSTGCHKAPAQERSADRASYSALVLKMNNKVYRYSDEEVNVMLASDGSWSLQFNAQDMGCAGAIDAEFNAPGWYHWGYESQLSISLAGRQSIEMPDSGISNELPGYLKIVHSGNPGQRLSGSFQFTNHDAAAAGAAIAAATIIEGSFNALVDE
jgi:hypothetical protein